MTEARTRFLEMIARPEAQIDLTTAALLIAGEEYADLDVEGYRSRLDALAERARPRVGAAGGNPFAAIDGLNTFLFDEMGFRGNTKEYFDPRNSYLNEVLDRKRGIPITLSLIYMEVGTRVGFQVEGVGFPGHFLVRHSSDGRHILIDPFYQGQILVPDDCQRRLVATYGEEVPLEARFFEPVGKKQILARVLHNLKGIYLKADDHERALSAIERLLALEPADPNLLRDRGLTHMNLNHHGRAVADLEGYLRIWPAAADAPAIRKQITAICRLTASLN
ncbi:MAG TPA: transglutaminase-like domain-containing protein [Candidatus Polarisedimenticolia bacterium]